MKKFKSVLALMMVLILALTACGSEPAVETEVAATEEPVAEEPVAEEPAAEVPVASGEPVEINYWSMWSATEPQAIALEASIAAFEVETGHTVNVEFKGRTGQRDGIAPALDAGETIDVFDEDIERVNITWGDYLLDLEDLAAGVDYDATADAKLMSAVRELGGGTLKTLPYQPMVFAIMYNKAIFEEAGVTELPTTWDEFLATCELIKAAGYDPLTTDDAYMPAMGGTHLSRIVGSEAVVEIVNGNKWDDPAVVQMAQEMEELASLGYFSQNIASNVHPIGQIADIAGETAAMYLNGSWLPNELKKDVAEGFEWGCMPYPVVDGGIETLDMSNWGAQCFAINKESKVPNEAFELITYLTKGEADKALSDATIGFPADTNAEWPAELTDIKEVWDELSPERVLWAGGIEYNADATPFLKENFNYLYTGAITAEEFVENMMSSTGQ